jgi:hypothetical protein
MIYFIVTTSIYNNCEIRKLQYITGISKLKQSIEECKIENFKIIVVENNGARPTFLDTLNCEVFYTSNNYLGTNNKGRKELQDILDCIYHYNIKDTDFIVKITGRYILNNDSEFMNQVKNAEEKYNCIIKYGSYANPVNYKIGDCITGLIGMTCSYVKQIEFPNENECVEWKWATIANQIKGDRICIVNRLGINICPLSNDYFSV